MDEELDFVSTGNIQVAPDDGSDQCFRFEVELDVLLRYQGVDRPRVAVNVSGEGVFAESIDHLPIGELVQLVAVLPDGALRVLATVERVVLSEEAAFVGGIPGLGLRFFLMDSELRARWEEYLMQVKIGGEALPLDPEAAEHRRDEAIMLSRRGKQQTRRRGRLALRIESQEKLLALYTRNVSQTGMFIPTTRPMEKGSKLSMYVTHPVSGREFSIDAEVRWVCNEGPEAEHGMGVRLLFPGGVSDEHFLHFVNEG
jgi:Tfp pilus assembly protein PilZ